MDFQTYQQLFIDVLIGDEHAAPYDNPDYINYVKLNISRQQRWLKTGELNKELTIAITNIKHKQTWKVITEPWCGDAAHTVPFIHRLSKLNPLIIVDYQLRDSYPFAIDGYLTNGSKSIPKLIIQTENDTLFVWGPRPIACQAVYDQLFHDHVDLEQKKVALQLWYNADKGFSFQKELLEILKLSLHSFFLLLQFA